MRRRNRLLGCIIGIAFIANAAGATPKHDQHRTVASISPDQKSATMDELEKSRKTTFDEAALVFVCEADLLRGAHEAVEEACGRAIALKPSDPTPHKLLGIARLIDNRFESAAYEFKRAVRLAPNDPGSQIGLGEALRGLDDYQGAVGAFTAALALSPRDGGIWNARCWTRGLFAKELRAGLADCNTALRLMPGHPASLDSRGLIYLRMGRLRLALRDYDAALAAKVKLPTAFYGRGVARLKSGDIQAGLRDLRQARSLDPTIDDAFAEAPLITPACNAALNTRFVRAVCMEPMSRVPESKKPQLPRSGRSAANDAAGQTGRVLTVTLSR